MLRGFRRGDAATMFRLMGEYFPEEGELLRWRPGAFESVVGRVFRPDVRFLLWLLERLRHPIVKVFALEVDGELGGAAILSFPRGAGYISSVVVDAPFRGRGYATQLVRACEAAAHRLGRRFAILDVLRSNAPARALYEKLGYRRLRVQSYYVRDFEGPDPTAAPPPSTVRTFVRRDAKALVPIAVELLPSPVREAMPPTESQFSSVPLVAAGLQSETAAWVVDRGSGPEGFVRATTSIATESGHLTAPIFTATVPEDLARAAVRAAVDWLLRQGVRRVICEIPEYNIAGLHALVREGFREAIPLETLYRPL